MKEKDRRQPHNVAAGMLHDKAELATSLANYLSQGGRA